MVRFSTRVHGDIPARETLSLLIGIALMLVVVALVFLSGELDAGREFVIRLLASFGIALASMGLTGFVEVDGNFIPFKVRAGGAIAILLLIYFVTPPVFQTFVPLPVPADDPEQLALEAIALARSKNWAKLDEMTEPRCSQGTKFADLPEASRNSIAALGPPVKEGVVSITNGLFQGDRKDPVRQVLVREELVGGTSADILVVLLATGERSAPRWALCGIGRVN
jgi:hypothetical protein